MQSPTEFKRTNTGNMYEDLIKDLNQNEEPKKGTFDFISEDEEENNLGDVSKTYVQRFEMNK